MTLGEKIRELRRAKDWTQEDIATATGLSISYISDIERGRTDPSLKTLQAIASALGVYVCDILRSVNGMASPFETIRMQELEGKQDEIKRELYTLSEKLNRAIECIEDDDNAPLSHET